MQSLALVLVLLAGCGPAGAGGDAGLGNGSDAGQAGLTGTEIECDKRSTRTVVYSDGSRTEESTVYALIDGLAPDDDYFLEATNFVYTPPITPPCPSGATCSNSGDPSLDSQATHWGFRSGSFVAGKLYVHCGGDARSYAAGGGLASVSSFRRTVRLHR